MKITNEISLYDFEAWSGAEDTKKTIIDNNKVDEFENLIKECYPDGITDNQLNDKLRFEDDWIFETLGINENEDENN